MLTVQRWLWSSFGQHLWVHLSSRLSPLCFVWYAETCLILKPGSGHITLLKPYTSFILAAEWSINVSTHLSGPSTMWTQAAFPVLPPPTSFSRSLQLWQNQSLFPEPASTWAPRGLDSHTKTLPSCPSKADLSFWSYLKCSLYEASADAPDQCDYQPHGAPTRSLSNSCICRPSISLIINTLV